MTDNDLPGPDELGTGFEKEETEYFAERGTDILRQEKKTVDPATGRIEIEKKGNPTCSCGKPYHSTAEFYWCSICDNPSCSKCISWFKSDHWCPTCLKIRYNMDRRVFWFLLYIKHDQLDADDLIQTNAVDDGTEVTVDRAAATLSDHGYITDDGNALTPSGIEALTAGKKLYEDDPDVASTLEALRVQEVANNGR